MVTRRTVAVVLLGAPGSGVSTLTSALLAAAAAPPCTGPSGHLRHGSYRAAGSTVHLLDPPGSPELAGELYAALRVAGLALFVVSPVQGLDARTVALWQSLEHLPKLVVLSQLDRPGADADEAVAVCQRVLGEGVHPLQLPLHDDDGSIGGLLDLLTLTVSEDGERRPAEAEHVGLVQALRAELVETVLTGSEDEDLFERFLDDVEPPVEVLERELAAAVGRVDLQPVLVAVPRRGVGLAELLALLPTLPGAPAEPVASRGQDEPVEPGTPVAEVVARGLVQVWSGCLEPGDALVLAGRAVSWPGPRACAGELVEVDLDGRPGDPIGSGPLLLTAWGAPPPQFPVGAPADEGLADRVAADPVARLDHDRRTGQLLLWTYGPEHAELLLDGLPSAPVQVPPGGRPVPLRVSVPGWAERAVRSDLLARGGELLTATPGGGAVLLDVRLPPAELPGYALALGRASSWTGRFERG